ncbi:MAG: CRISPR-associated endonuclease Cas1, partial [Clostridia bacterium]|nr:CRISPR-associated endonuclease Cas1 [Clostridia bacterium]
TERGVPFVRYADDIALFADSAEELRERYDAAVLFLTERLALTPHPSKCAQGAPEQLSFLGHRFRRDRFGLTAYAPARERPVREDWQEEELADPRGRTDILSAGCLRREAGTLVFETAGEEREIPVAAVDNLCIHSDVTFDVGVLKCAAENGVMISVMDQTDGLIGRFMPNTPLRSPVVTREQLAAYYEPDHRVALAKEFVLAAIHNLRLVIRYYHKMHPHTACQKALTAINAAEKKIKECGEVEELLVLEAGVHAAYFGLFDHFLENTEFRFEKRTRRPPKNEVNAMISFCDTVLYHLVAAEIYPTPLDIRVGFLHASNRRQESLNLDVAESFRPLVVDRTVLTLLNLRAIRREHFDYQEDRVLLNREGQRVVLRALYRRLGVSVEVSRKQHMTYEEAIREDVRKLVRYFKNGETFHAFHQVR